MQVASEDDGETLRPIHRRGGYLGVECREIAPTKITRPAERYRGEDRSRLAIVSGQCRDERIEVQLTFPAGNLADQMDATAPEQGAGKVDTGRGIVVSAHDDDMQAGAPRERIAQEAVEPRHRRHRRIGDVVDVARHDQGVGIEFDQPVEQPREERVVLLVATVAVELLTYVPVGRMDETHSAG